MLESYHHPVLASEDGTELARVEHTPGFKFSFWEMKVQDTLSLQKQCLIASIDAITHCFSRLHHIGRTVKEIRCLECQDACTSTEDNAC